MVASLASPRALASLNQQPKQESDKMGCSGFKRIFKWRRKQTKSSPRSASQPPYGTRPTHTANGSISSEDGDLGDIEKAYIRGHLSDDKETSVSGGRNDRRSPISALPKSAANYRPNVHPKFSAYSGIASRAGRRDDSPYSSAVRRRGRAVSDTWTESQASTQVSSRELDQKLKDECGVDDPEQEARRKKAEEIRRKFEEEEQERLDFLQMM